MSSKSHLLIDDRGQTGQVGGGSSTVEGCPGADVGCDACELCRHLRLQGCDHVDELLLVLV